MILPQIDPSTIKHSVKHLLGTCTFTKFFIIAASYMIEQHQVTDIQHIILVIVILVWYNKGSHTATKRSIDIKTKLPRDKEVHKKESPLSLPLKESHRDHIQQYSWYLVHKEKIFHSLTILENSSLYRSCCYIF